MAWRRDLASIVADAGRELAEALGGDLRSLVLYGSATGPGFRPDASDVNFAAVVDVLEHRHLGRVAQWWVGWRGDRVAVPLLLSLADLERSRDVFPLEFLDIRARHHLLAGSDVFADITVAPDAVRLECEREAKGKLILLRELYIEMAGSLRDQRALIVDSRKSFVAVVRGLLHLRGQPWELDEATAVRGFERAFACRLPTLVALAERHAGAPEQRFGEYLAEIELLATLADREARGGR